jgi:hypothetical protein
VIDPAQKLPYLRSAQNCRQNMKMRRGQASKVILFPPVPRLLDVIRRWNPANDQTRQRRDPETLQRSANGPFADPAMISTPACHVFAITDCLNFSDADFGVRADV